MSISETSRISNFLNKTTTLQNDIQRGQERISSGKKNVSMTELAEIGKGEILLSFESDLNKTTTHNGNIEAGIRYSRFVDKQLDSTYDLATRVKRNLISLKSTSGPTMQFTGIAKNDLQSLQRILNSTFEGKYIFSGTSTELPPVNNIIDDSNLIDGKPSNNYYVGGNDRKKITVSEGFELEFGVRADNDSFQNLIAALHKGIEAISADGLSIDSTKVDEAMGFIDYALNFISQNRAELGNNTRTMEDQEAENSELIDNLKELISSITNTDTPLESVIVQQNITSLQAAFMMFSKINATRLYDFL